MKQLLKIVFLILLSLSIKETVSAGILSDKIFGKKDCSQYSTKTLSGLNDYVRCKKGLKTLDNKFLKLNKKNKFDPNVPCDQYSTKTFSGLSKKIRCKRAKNK